MREPTPEVPTVLMVTYVSPAKAPLAHTNPATCAAYPHGADLSK